VEDLLAREDASWPLEHRTGDGVFLWPFIRHFLFTRASHNTSGLNTAHHRPRKLSFGKRLLLYKEVVQHNPFRFANQDIVFFSTGVVASHLVGATFVNRLYDDLARQTPRKALILEESYQNRCFRPRSYPRVGHTDTLFGTASLLSRLRSIPSREAKTAESLIRAAGQAYQGLVTPRDLQNARNILCKTIREMPILRKAFSLLLSRLHPKLIVLEDGHYGFRAQLLKWADENGIITAELQHGYITPSHFAYNYAPSLLLDTDFVSHLPRNMLTFGPYWNQMLQTSASLHSIGYPFLTKRVQSQNSLFSQGTNTRLLYISDAVEPEKTCTFILRLIELTDNNTEIVFRPHPGEHPVIRARYGSLLASPKITLDNSSSLYSSLDTAHAVIGTWSTALYEALAWSKQVFVVDNPVGREHMDPEIFNIVKSPEDLEAKLRSDTGKQAVDSDHIFSPNWKANYDCFLQNALGKPTFPPSRLP
jgi:hypothetical protein